MKKQKMFSILLACLLALSFVSCEDSVSIDDDGGFTSVGGNSGTGSGGNTGGGVSNGGGTNTGNSGSTESCISCGYPSGNQLLGYQWSTTRQGRGFLIHLQGYSSTYNSSWFTMHEVSFVMGNYGIVYEPISEYFYPGLYTASGYGTETLIISFNGPNDAMKRYVSGTATISGNKMYYTDDAGLNLTLYCYQCYWD